MIKFKAPYYEGGTTVERTIKKLDYGFDNFVEILQNGSQYKISKKNLINDLKKYAPQYMNEYFPNYENNIKQNIKELSDLQKTRDQMKIYGFND